MNILPLFIVVPLGAAILTPLLVRVWKGFPDLIGNLVCGFLMILSLWSVRLADQTVTVFAGGWEPINGIPVGIAMVMDGLSILMLLIVNVIGFLVMVYSVSYMKHYTDKGKYVALFLLLMTGLNGVVISGDLFNLFVFLEITAIASYSLVAFGVEAEELEASFKYQVLGGTGSMFLLLSIALFYQLTGTLNLADASLVLSSKAGNPGIILIGILFMTGFGLKAALMPFHAWLPDAHPSAPAPISAMLSGVVIKVLGVYALIRIFINVIGLNLFPQVPILFLVLGTLSMVAGALLALGQTDIKRMFAYSSISQIGYVIFAFGLGTELGMLAGLFHLLNHANFKSLLFLNAGAIDYSTGTRDLESLGGLSKKMPVTAVTSFIGSLSISGIPPLGGFWSKLLIILAAVKAGHVILAIVAVLVSIVTLAYYLKSQKMAFWGSLKKQFESVKEAPFSMCLSMIVLALISVGLGLLLLPGIKSLILDPAVQVLTNGTVYAKMVLGG